MERCAGLGSQLVPEAKMRAGLFLVISLLLFVLWAGSFLMLHVASMMIHLLLLVSALFLAGHLVRDTSLS